eukprot:7032098-Lingulodinium_polyedra.AAC.1
MARRRAGLGPGGAGRGAVAVAGMGRRPGIRRAAPGAAQGRPLAEARAEAACGALPWRMP